MRSGAYTVQQTLTAEAASVLKHSLGLAWRRGHGQVTPLHVAVTLLGSRSSLLRKACLKSQQTHQASHPLHCRALELCFNVALNRLPTAPAPFLIGQPASLSNALIAALKRAQAHQRRGCIEQQQPLLTVKVELEQLIVSILDDPSVSRVMREAGFSSTTVKNNIEECSSALSGTFWQTHFSEQNPFFFSSQKKAPSNHITDSASVKEDVKLVFEVFSRDKRKNTVIVGDCLSMTEGLVLELKAKIERGEVPEEMKNVHFVKFYFPPLSLRFMVKEDVEKHLTGLKRRVDSIAAAGDGAIIYTGDLRWTAEENLNGEELIAYSAVDHLVTEIGRLISDCNFSKTKVWLLATASYQTYLKCQMRQPPLEVQWALQAISVPSGGLGLSLHASSVHDSQGLEMKPFAEHDKLACCEECAINYEKDVRSIKSTQQNLLPPWLQPQEDQKDEMLELRRKWNRLCHSLHQVRHNQNHLSGEGYPCASSYPLMSFTDSDSKFNHSVPKFRQRSSCTVEFDFSNSAREKRSGQANLDSLKNNEDKEVKITLALGKSLSLSSQRPAKETSELYKTLQDNVPWQSRIIPSIADALKHSVCFKKQTWLLIQGNDVIGKRRLAGAVAESVLGSADLLLHMNMRCNESTSCYDRLVRAFRNNKRLVVLVENVDLADTLFLKLLADEFETGAYDESRETKGSISRAVVILTESICAGHEDCEMNQDSIIEMKLIVTEKSSSFRTPTSDKKRKAVEWDVCNKAKTSRIEDTSSLKKDLWRQRPSFNTLDLNMKADEDDQSEETIRDTSPISSDITGEIAAGPHLRLEFLESIKNRYIFDRSASRDNEMKGVFMSKMKGTLEAIFGDDKVISFSVEDKVLDGISFGSSYFLHGLFEKWLKDIFQRGLETVKIGGKDGIREIRLSYGGIRGNAMENGYMGTCLPSKIQVSFMG
ncbi:mannosyl-oligosaccharide 1,2-alpha-mannosidase MNS1-like [Hibiscus syriacus]|uniref:Mannosyl-oligosaccharide 1,2-alpha-mannosidase MNS1-like n=1 Tax=Hibiscus syriacus TaxID=106335 RepID=A0A6A3D8A3_HIBSY|nr:protein SMAX1-LIKE 4-like [Hibiscus syriacus]KAE8735472.1 mannosyl-oligosaccharide 1,2-alpha-mannosidase MNS1-like [Hibiscus syriacus]